MESQNTTHRWRFFRVGGVDQVRIETGADFVHLDKLDPKLWVALACPVRGIEFDEKTLALIDRDKDGRLRIPEILEAVKWTVSLLKNPDVLPQGGDLPLSAINDSTPDGKQILASAKEILINLGKPDAAAISVADTMETAKVFAATKFNGDGVFPLESIDEPELKAAATDIAACVGSEPDRGGKLGLTQARLDQFLAEGTSFSDWWKKAEADSSNLLPLGEATSSAVGVLNKVSAKVDDYFARCRLAAFDSRAVGALNRLEVDYLAIASKDMTFAGQEVAGFPLARIEAGRPLPLKDGLNPAWIEAIEAFATQIVKPLLGDTKTSLAEAEWVRIKAKFAAHQDWGASKAGAPVEKLGLNRVREILAGKAPAELAALIARDKALEPEMNTIINVERLARYCRDLHRLLNNYVSFADFYSRQRKAIFQAGRLYLDQRSCDLVLTVEDPAKHTAMAGMAGAYLAYCDCVRKATGEKLSIVVAFTDGDSEQLMVGRNGVFYDRKGRDWDATITKIIDNPISIRQAFFAPYKKLIRWVEEQTAKRAAAAEAEADQKLAAAANATLVTDKTKPPPPPKKFDTGTLAAIGLVFTTLLGALGGIFSSILKLSWWQIPLAFIGLLLAVSLPSVISGWLKLRKRNLGPILDANGWAVNARAKINVPFGASLTQIACLPANSERSLDDPFAANGRRWVVILLMLILSSLLVVVWMTARIWADPDNAARSFPIKIFRPNPSQPQPTPEKAADPAKKN